MDRKEGETKVLKLYIQINVTVCSPMRDMKVENILNRSRYGRTFTM